MQPQRSCPRNQPSRQEHFCCRRSLSLAGDRLFTPHAHAHELTALPSLQVLVGGLLAAVGRALLLLGRLLGRLLVLRERGACAERGGQHRCDRSLHGLSSIRGAAYRWSCRSRTRERDSIAATGRRAHAFRVLAWGTLAEDASRASATLRRVVT